MRNYCNKTSKGSEIIILVVYSTRALSIVILSPQWEGMTPATCVLFDISMPAVDAQPESKAVTCKSNADCDNPCQSFRMRS
ncbi:hypothetical protein AB3S75_017256 [Citrus x aurantiifolia]